MSSSRLRTTPSPTTPSPSMSPPPGRHPYPPPPHAPTARNVPGPSAPPSQRNGYYSASPLSSDSLKLADPADLPDAADGEPAPKRARSGSTDSPAPPSPLTPGSPSSPSSPSTALHLSSPEKKKKETKSPPPRGAARAKTPRRSRRLRASSVGAKNRVRRAVRFVFGREPVGVEAEALRVGVGRRAGRALARLGGCDAMRCDAIDAIDGCLGEGGGRSRCDRHWRWRRPFSAASCISFHFGDARWGLGLCLGLGWVGFVFIFLVVVHFRAVCLSVGTMPHSG
ncbi:hypothetical protein B0H14DRAFT_1603824 [Mycena olivaceomarginata]|nr:hypothetical protein B0H14DRAFT_1603824 [Mycena olivaceomarginata]